MGRIKGVSLWLLCGSILAPSSSLSEVSIFEDRDLREQQDSKKYGSVALYCPDTAKQSITDYSANRVGSLGIYAVHFSEGVAVAVTFYIKLSGGDWVETVNYDVRNLDDPDDLGMALDLMNLGNALLNEVCNGSPEAKQRFRELLDSNLSILGLSPEDYPSDF